LKSWEQYLGRLLIALRLDSIKNKIVALAIVATLAPALSTAVLSYVQNRRALTASLQGELQRIGSQSAREIEIWVRDRLYDVRIFESSFEVSENLDRIRAGGPRSLDAHDRLTDYLTQVYGRFQFYPELLAVDAEGVTVASTRDELPDFRLPADWLGDLRTSDRVLGEPYIDELSGGVAVRIAQRVESADARFLGALVATLDFAALEVILDGFARGEGGSVDLIVDDGRRIVGSGGGPGLEPVVSADVLAALDGAGRGTVQYEGAAGAVLGTITPVPDWGWAVVTQTPTDEAYAQIEQLRNTTALLVSLLLVFVGSVAYLLGLFIVRPLTRLEVGAAAVSRGDLSVDLPVTGGGEVGNLTEAFNRMVSQLRRSQKELSEANAALREHNVELERLSMTDALTGLYNRRYVMNELDRELARSERHERPFGLLMIDVDQFKQYNDAHGHLAGDAVLTSMGRVIHEATREHDVPGRFGGEEFIVLLPDCDLQGALDAAHRIRERLEEEVFEGGAVTCSIGAAAFPEHGTEMNEVVAAADLALYGAKDAGRDRVVAAAGSKRRAASRKISGAAKRATPGKKAASKKKAGPTKKAAPRKKGAAGESSD